MTPEVLQQRLGYAFRDPALLRQALTHRSHGQPNNERLEFLGDSVLNCVVSSLLYERFTKVDEGDLSRVRANLVRQQALHEIAQRLELSQYLLLGEGETKSGGHRLPSILGDTVEAIFGAVFLDGGFEAARTAIGALYAPVLANVDPRTLGKDAKTLLQEYLQGHRVPLPVYAVVATHGAAHSQQFEVECSIPKLAVQVLGAGASRRAAEQAAARRALERVQALPASTVRRSRGKAGGKVADEPSERGGEKGREKGSERGGEKPGEKAADRGAERSADRASDRAAEAASSADRASPDKGGGEPLPTAA